MSFMLGSHLKIKVVRQKKKDDLFRLKFSFSVHFYKSVSKNTVTQRNDIMYIQPSHDVIDVVT